jgi:hypothetical protein
VGEHILSVVQEMETFCTSGAQADMVAALGDAALFATGGWQLLRTLLDVKEEESLSGLCIRSSCKAVVLAAEMSMVIDYRLCNEILQYLFDDSVRMSTGGGRRL